ncbi:MAG: ATP-NAD kinase [Candidatus Thorarchaeota archaeon]|nr:MAG: ATP-NAD kinase [Candidatus Thorarchaeota archaeon]
MIIGLLVNPIAGMGGRVGLKGTDGVVDEAVRRGATQVAPGRALEFLVTLSSLKLSGVELITCPGAMGAEICKRAGIKHKAINIRLGPKTTAKDTIRCVRALYESAVRLLVFVGGDGTARDILDAVKEGNLSDLLVLGVPSGVKMYSGVFVVNPSDAAEVVRLVNEGATGTTEFEIMDADEAAIRQDKFMVQLYGYLTGPSVPARFQGSKQVSPETVDEHEAQEAIAKYVIDTMPQGQALILGPGTTIKALADLLRIKKTTLGVDLFHEGIVYNDVNESKILEVVKDFAKAWIVVSPIGHQGVLFGRGNQQISPHIIQRIGRDNIRVLCTASKLTGIEGGTLKVDTGDPEVDKLLRGYIRVVTDYSEMRLVKIE